MSWKIECVNSLPTVGTSRSFSGTKFSLGEEKKKERKHTETRDLFPFSDEVLKLSIVVYIALCFISRRIEKQGCCLPLFFGTPIASIRSCPALGGSFCSVYSSIWQDSHGVVANVLKEL